MHDQLLMATTYDFLNLSGDLTLDHIDFELVDATGEVLKNLTAQSCGCGPEISCSQYGYCGSGDDYWGQGYKEGSCTSSGGSTTTTPRTNGGGGSTVADVVTPELFNKIIYQVFRPSFYISKIKANWSKYMIWALIVHV
ncbi:hypothetical protein Pyn_33017 [Prunus yedoensis var. nudiflora]|uniref:Chitin-binding type-1 domain-containing protein n=1 Tax=Prunus yedoensis var. nudiflora TaxID=2094558 RepID=A0A314YQH3_PRUYE|nr:hypothetical protein Pyn_33017 [Prunus yedoensis var. nudiflora]